MYMYIERRGFESHPPEEAHSVLGKVTALGVLCCIHLTGEKVMYIHVYSSYYTNSDPK